MMTILLLIDCYIYNVWTYTGIYCKFRKSFMNENERLLETKFQFIHG